ncbi:DUF4179 domain-containing protein [Paenibacillus sp. NPDC058071]|uniref:DUF4179 domain-containing protein n=1 Tax=Paenibacillus sp. NPDC058071 TaxID=3346326 RepID=UPI0036DD50D8
MRLEADTEKNRDHPDDRDFQSDREQLEQIADETSEDKLDEAIRTGLQRGTVRRRKQLRGCRGVQTLLAVMCGLMLLTAFVRLSPGFAALLREIPGFGGFVTFIERDQTLNLAINNRFVQPVNLSDERNGYKLTVQGIIADEQRLVILFSGEGPGITRSTQMGDYQLTRADGEQLGGSISFGFSYLVSEESKDKPGLYDMFDVNLMNGYAMPDQVRLELKLGEEMLSVDITVDKSRFEHLTETVEIHESFEMDGLRFELEKAIITPLQTRIIFTEDPSNKARLNHFVNAALIDEKGRRMTPTGGFGSSSLLFHSPYFDKPKRLTFTADGVLSSEKGKKLVINTETGQTLETPDQRVRLEGPAENGSFKITLNGLTQPESLLGYWVIEPRASFTDALGRTHQLADFPGTRTTIAIQPTETGANAWAYYDLPYEDFAQPLTFEVYQYPHYQERPIAVDIK